MIHSPSRHQVDERRLRRSHSSINTIRGWISHAFLKMPIVSPPWWPPYMEYKSHRNRTVVGTSRSSCFYSIYVLCIFTELWIWYLPSLLLRRHWTVHMFKYRTMLLIGWKRSSDHVNTSLSDQIWLHRVKWSRARASDHRNPIKTSCQNFRKIRIRTSKTCIACKEVVNCELFENQKYSFSFDFEVFSCLCKLKTWAQSIACVCRESTVIVQSWTHFHDARAAMMNRVVEGDW